MSKYDNKKTRRMFLQGFFLTNQNFVLKTKLI